jgi:hypothetical protein
MKKISFILAVALTATLSSCSFMSTTAKLTSTATIVQPITAVFADLKVSSKKIVYVYTPNQSVIAGGTNNAINTAVREALLANGNADVLVGIEKLIKYDEDGEIASITITGYPAKYVNFRSPSDEYLCEISKQESAGNSNQGASLFGKLKTSK